MRKIILPEKHWSLTVCNDIKEIITPRLTKYGITCFVYGRLFPDGTVSTLTTHGNGQLYHFNNEFVVTMPTIISSNKNRTIALLNENDEYQHIAYAYRNYFEIDKMIGITEFHKNYIDMYFFAATPGTNNIVNFYLNNLNILENFIFYFKNKARKLISKTYQNKIILSEKMFAGAKTFFDSSGSTQVNNPTKRNNILSKRELECIELIMIGNTAKDAAKLLHLSPRTIEFHLKNIREKLGCHRKADIIDFVIEEGIL